MELELKLKLKQEMNLKQEIKKVPGPRICAFVKDDGIPIILGSLLLICLRERKDFMQGLPLYKATLNGDREMTKQIQNQNEGTLLRSRLTEGHETALHVAVGARQAAVVKELVGRMESEDLELRDGRGNIALCVAVATGSVKIAKILMEKNAELAFIRGADNKTPLYIAAVSGCPERLGFYTKFLNNVYLISTTRRSNETCFWLVFMLVC
ncbi:hypothetical protein POUND7_008535 [Theobroma cacao]